VRCNDNSLYSGITNDLVQRVKKHNSGKGAKFTSVRNPVKLVFSEKYDNISLARKREEQVKRWSKMKKEDMIKGFPRLRSG
ncbi:MAG: GIY-YIG nuclease family protein, partial [Planctomycetota bacterium]